MDEFFHSIEAARTIYVLGIINLVAGTLIFFTYRCLPGSRIAGRLTNYGLYKRLFRYHCHIWKVFIPSVAIHAFFAIMLYGWPG
jgi:hypothetical protein